MNAKKLRRLVESTALGVVLFLCVSAEALVNVIVG